MPQSRYGSTAQARSAASTARSKRELKRRSAIETVIGHCKTDGHLDRNFLKGRQGDQINAVMTAVGYNFRLILKWLKALLCKIVAAILAAIMSASALKPAS